MSFLLKQLEALSSALRKQHQEIKKPIGRVGTSASAGSHFNRSTINKRSRQRLNEMVLSDLKKRRALGETYSALAADLNQRGLRGPNGARWYTASVRILLQS